MEDKYTDVVVRTTLINIIAVPEEIAHDRDLVDDFVQNFGKTKEVLSTDDIETDVLEYWSEDENGHEHRHYWEEVWLWI